MAAPTAYTDAQGQNDISRNVRQYKDLDLFFNKKSVSKDIANSDIKDYISKCTNDDWEKVNKFLKDN